MTTGNDAKTANRDPLYKRLLGPSWESLPETVRRMHSVEEQVRSHGTVTVRRGRGPVPRLIGRLLGLPREGTDIEAQVTFVRDGDREVLRRNYGGEVFSSIQSEGTGNDAGLLREDVGPVSMALDLQAGPDGLRFDVSAVRVCGLPLPKLLWPVLDAAETAEDDRYRFSVSVSLPAIGNIVHYAGELRIEDPPKAARKSRNR